MAATPRALSRGLLSATSATLYTVPASTTAILTSIVLTNTSATAATLFISLDGFLLVPGTSIGPLAFTVIDLRQALTTGKLVAGYSGTASVIACHISGAEVT
jgi:hypothetical protein